MEELTKKCSFCKKELPLVNFARNRSAKDGLQNKCRPCTTEYCRQWRLNHPERFKEIVNTWNKKNAARKAEVAREWRKANAGVIKTKKHAYYASHPEVWAKSQAKREGKTEE